LEVIQYLLDTNIIIYYFNGITDDQRIDELLINSFNISIISEIEFLGWNGFLSDQLLYQKAQTLISYANILKLDKQIANKTIALRQQHKIKTPDAIIAATALIHHLGVATNNINDFKCLGIETLGINVRTF
jgi:predicted nucleic acid-binding protein